MGMEWGRTSSAIVWAFLLFFLFFTSSSFIECQQP